MDSITWYMDKLLRQDEELSQLSMRTVTKFLRLLSVLELDLVKRLINLEITGRKNEDGTISLNLDEEKARLV